MVVVVVVVVVVVLMVVVVLRWLWQNSRQQQSCSSWMHDHCPHHQHRLHRQHASAFHPEPYRLVLGCSYASRTFLLLPIEQLLCNCRKSRTHRRRVDCRVHER